MPYAICPGCDEEIYVARPRKGAQLTCNACNADLEVVETNPVELDWVYEDDDEWDDDDYEDDDDE